MRALQAAGGDTSRSLVLDTLVRDVATPSTNPSLSPYALIDVIVRLDISFCGRLAYISYALATFTPPGTPPLFWQPHPAPFPSNHKGSDAGG